MEKGTIESELILIMEQHGRWTGDFTLDMKDISKKRNEHLKKYGVNPTKIKFVLPKKSRIMGMDVIR